MDLYLLQSRPSEGDGKRFFSYFPRLRIRNINNFPLLEKIESGHNNSVFILFDDFKHRYESYMYLLEKKAKAIIVVTEMKNSISSNMDNVHILSSPIDMDELSTLLESIQDQGKCKSTGPPEEGIIWGKSKAMQEIRRSLVQFSKNNHPVLISGPIGSGKTFFARYLARLSSCGKEIIEVNSATINEHLGEDLLFGHTNGAFTNCREKRTGLCKLAEGSVLFMDEFHTLPPSIQPKLLRILETGKFRPIGSDEEISTNFKLIAASSASRDELEEKLLPELLARIGPYRLEIPPLRERGKDIVLFIDQIEKEMRKSHGSNGRRITDLGPWQRYGWPGNVRELTKNVFFFLECGKLPYTLQESEEKYKLDHPEEMDEKGKLKRIRKRTRKKDPTGSI